MNNGDKICYSCNNYQDDINKCNWGMMEDMENNTCRNFITPEQVRVGAKRRLALLNNEQELKAVVKAVAQGCLKDDCTTCLRDCDDIGMAKSLYIKSGKLFKEIWGDGDTKRLCKK